MTDRPTAAQKIARAPRSTASWAALLGTLLLIAFLCYGQSAAKLFWYDELITLRIAALPTLGDILRFFEAGKDTTSFLPAMLVHGFQHLPGRPEITTRLPFGLAYVLTALGVWLIAERRYPAGYATMAALLLPLSWTMFFASEDRAYAFVLLGTALALVSWQRAGDDHGSRPTLAVVGVFAGLALAVLFHFFAIFLLVPFLAAEWAYTRVAGRFRPGVWLAILLSPATLAVMLPNMLHARRIYAHSFWSKPSFEILTSTYTLATDPLTKAFAEIAVLIALVLWNRGRQRQPQPATHGLDGFTGPEWVLLLGITLVPFLGFAGGHFLGVYRAQYFLYFELGVLLLVTGALAESLGRSRAGGWAFAALFLLLLLVHARDFLRAGMRQLAGKPVAPSSEEFDPAWVGYLETTTLPIVAEGPDTLMLALQYAPPLRSRLVLLTSHTRAAQIPGAMTNELNMEIFAEPFHLPVQPYDAFVATHPDFLLLVNPSQVSFTWLLHSLREQERAGADIHIEPAWEKPSGGGDVVYRVHIGAASAQTPAATPGV